MARYLNTAGAIALGFAALGVSGVTARAEPAVGVTVVCPATGPGIAVCVGIGTVLHELWQIANGKEGFGENGAIMQVLAAPVKLAGANIAGAANESGEGAKLLRVTTGISVGAIEKNGGVLGGGLSGGENSFFRKNLGVRF